MNREPSPGHPAALRLRRRFRSAAGASLLLSTLLGSAPPGLAQQAPPVNSPLQPSPGNPSMQTTTPSMQSTFPAMPVQSMATTPGSSPSKFLLPLVISALTPVLQAGMGCVFDRLFSFMGSNPSPACVQPNQTAVVRPPDNPSPNGVNIASADPSALALAAGAMAPQPAQPGNPPADAGAPQAQTQAQTLASTPVLSFIVNKLSDASPQATVTQSVQFANVQQAGSNLAFDIRTGEVFAILFATSVPGRVRLVNTDALRQVAASEVYEALPAADNRMPRDWQGGITMAGAKGTEYLDVNFTPCVSPRYASDPRVTMFQGQLPACTQETDAAPLTRGGGAGAKAMVFPASAAPGQPIGLAPADYAKGDPLTFRITIHHQ